MALYRPKFGIGIDPLIAFKILVTEMAVTNNIPISATAFRVIKEIEDYRGEKRNWSQKGIV
jgi:hypothetical protein